MALPKRLKANSATVTDNIFSNNIQDEIGSGNILILHYLNISPDLYLKVPQVILRCCFPRPAVFCEYFIFRFIYVFGYIFPLTND